MQDCSFCAEGQGLVPLVGGMVYEDELVFAHHYFDAAAQTSYLGHVMLKPKRHLRGYADLPDEVARAMGLLTARLSRALEVCAGAERVYAVFYGEVVSHLHVHLIARYRDLPAENLRWNAEDWPGAPRGDAAAVAALCDRLRDHLRDHRRGADESRQGASR